MKSGKAVMLVLFAALLVLGGCATEEPDANTGSLEITLPPVGVARSVLPDVNTAIASYRITGNGPGGASFSNTVACSQASVNGLVPGAWTIIVYGVNPDGITLYQGSATVIIYAGNTSSVTITVSPLAGNGTIGINVGWVDTLNNPVLTASLSNAAQGAIPLTGFTIDNPGKTASLANSSIPAGYYILRLALSDNGSIVGSPQLEIVRIMEGQSTPVVFTISSGQGSLNASVSNDLQHPVELALSGVNAVHLTGTSMTITATADTPVDQYLWFVNGTLIASGTESTLTFGSNLTPGQYTLSVVVSKGAVLSSTNALFTVSDTAPQTFGLFSERVPENVVWDTDAKIDVWTDYGANALVADDLLAPGFGGKALRLTGTGSWMGVALRVNPLSAVKDLSAFAGGSLKFMYKGNAGFKIGIKSGNGVERWVTSTELAGYGLVLTNAWCTVSVPLACFAGIDWAAVQQYLMFVADSGTGYAVGDVHTLDEIHFSTTDGGTVATDDFFTLFSDTQPLDVVWETDIAMAVWTDWSAGAAVTTLTAGTGEGGESWKITGTGAWIGIGLHTVTGTRDLSAYSHLNLMYKGSNNFKIGIKGGGTEAWRTAAQLAAYGLVLDNTWRTVKVPLSAFSGINLATVDQYLMFVQDAPLGYTVGAVHELDNIYFSKN